MKLASRTLAALLASAIVVAAAAPAEARGGRRGSGAAVATGLLAGVIGALAVSAMTSGAQAAPAYGYAAQPVQAPTYRYGYGYEQPTYYSNGYERQSYYNNTAYERPSYYPRNGYDAHREANQLTHLRRGERVVKVIRNPDSGEAICVTNYGQKGYCDL